MVAWILCMALTITAVVGWIAGAFNYSEMFLMFILVVLTQIDSTLREIRRK